MRAAIESEAHRIGAALVTSYSNDQSAIQFSTSSGTDRQQGRLWTEAPDPAHYEALCRVVKKDAVYDHDAGLWVKRASHANFDAYRTGRQQALSELVEKNRKYALEVLGGKIANHDG
jgi:hypothetical protein